jgi:hypothetical protein
MRTSCSLFLHLLPPRLSTDLQELQFLEAYAVPYWAVDSHTWITHGTLTTLAGLTADLMYGFISPTGECVLQDTSAHMCVHVYWAATCMQEPTAGALCTVLLVPTDGNAVCFVLFHTGTEYIIAGSTVGRIAQ